MDLWALWNVSYQRWYTNGSRIELFEHDQAFSMACGLTAAAPITGPIWRAVKMSLAEAEKLARELNLVGVYEASGVRRRTEPWSSEG